MAAAKQSGRAGSATRLYNRITHSSKRPLKSSRSVVVLVVVVVIVVVVVVVVVVGVEVFS